MALWIVQRYVDHRTFETHWMDIDSPRSIPGAAHSDSRAWEAPDPGTAFRLAVLDNDAERLSSTSYRVLPYAGGANFNLSLNVEGEAHAPEASS